MSEIDSTSQLKSSPEARGKRLKSLRMMMDLSRKLMEEKYQISASTMQSWEDGKAGGLTVKGAKRIVAAFREEGVNCNIEWLLHGTGSAPYVTDRTSFDHKYNDKQHDANVSSVGNQHIAILQELSVFRQYNHHAIDFIVTDDGMGPHYLAGDYVAGTKRYGQDIERLVGLDCLVETSDGEILLRRLRKGNQDSLYSLTCTNPNTSVANITLYNKELISAAPVIWHRRIDKL